MKQFFALSLLAISGAVLASAAPVDFTTSGVFACNGNLACGGSGSSITMTSGTQMLTINYAFGSQIDLNVTTNTTTNFGQIDVVCTTCNGNTNSFDFTGITLTLGISQGPDPFSGSFVPNFSVGTFNGFLSRSGGNDGGSLFLPFLPLSNALVNGNTTVTYIVNQSVTGYPISIGNQTTLNGLVSLDVRQDNPVPEPGTLVLTSLAFLGLGLFGRKRRQ